MGMLDAPDSSAIAADLAKKKAEAEAKKKAAEEKAKKKAAPAPTLTKRPSPGKSPLEREAAKTTAREAAVKAAGRRTALRDVESGLREDTAGLSEVGTLEDLGISDEDFAKREELRQALFGKQRGRLIAQQGAQERGMSEALSRRLASAGLRGTGAAEKLAQVSSAQLQQAQAEQAIGLETGQMQQNLAALEAEGNLQAQAALQLKQLEESGKRMAESLIQNGVEAERARQFADEQGILTREMQRTQLQMNADQFKEQMAVTLQELKNQGRQLDLDEATTEFNKSISRAELEQPGFFGQFWSDVGGLFGF